MKHLLTVGAVLLAVNSAVSAADAYEMIAYADTPTDPVVIDTGPVGLSIGDEVIHQGALRMSAKGPVVGSYIAKTEVIFQDLETGKTIRSFMAEHTFDDGSLYLIDTVHLDHSDTVKVGHEHTGTITGGTGKYHAIRGSYRLQVVATDTGYMSVMTYSLVP